MYFQSLADFWHMGGYGLFVWLSFASTYALLAALIGYSHYQQAQFKQHLKNRLAREQRVKQHQEQTQ
ncbi:heme exporter protein CcmD [Rheinheimera baltica]|uniref:Heme exporter protein D n=1 Tax=Rheinheimera baltica TaxID=67576 RepID=A0ABT9HUX4_9GAMM|nr:heme exporter protein CcmD [Rheinheimera baltica]MDP5134901.1 heme exporter protein CcmD [Rheinheimera baltica]MDP5143137.1 heme exporter protein CcmD [Rheinheimera baltica]MDP5149847.1 heme exporter protein CcmD [Rheinheimera baltica]MDP5189797.1 heme exporter protein CcmD [Rheinheimera baltica]